MATDTQLQLASEQFSTVLQLRLQQMGSLLRGRTMEGTHVGKMASPVQYVSPFAMAAPAGPFAPLQLYQPQYQRRWLSPAPYERALPIDSFDQLQTMIDPQSQLVQAGAAAVGRAWDDSLISAAFGSAQTGTDIAALSTETFSTSSYGVAVTFDDGSTSTGLTIKKLREARRILRHSHALDNPSEPVTMLIGSQQESDLLALTQVTSDEYNPRRDGVPVLDNGVISHFLGFDFIVTERLQTASSARKCIAFVKSGLYLGMWKDISTVISYREDLSGRPLQIYISVMHGASRLEPGRLVEVDCYDTTGADNI